MRTIPRTFLVAFAVTGLLLALHTWWPQLFALAWGFSFALFYVGGFAALMLVVGWDLFRPRRITRTGIVVRGVILALVALVLGLCLIPSFRDVIVIVASIAGTLIFAGALFLLIGSVLWSCFRDYLDLLGRRPEPTAPQEWHLLEDGQAPATDSAASERAKERFAHSFELKITCVPRTSHYGLAARPLRMDE